jgi:hypothetical protein
MSQLTLNTRKKGQRNGRNTSIKLSKNKNTELKIKEKPREKALLILANSYAPTSAYMAITY